MAVPSLVDGSALPISSDSSSEVAAVWCSDGSEESRSSSASSIAAENSSCSTSSITSPGGARQVFISHGLVRLAIPIKSSGRNLLLQLREAFLFEARESLSSESGDNDVASATAVLLERFIRFVLKRSFAETDAVDTEQGSLLVLEALVQTFEDHVGHNDDVHTVVGSLSVSQETKRQIVSTIVRASHFVGRNDKAIGTPNTALFQAVCNEKAVACAIFGGQGTDNYFDMLIELYDTYEPLVMPLLLQASSHLQQLVAVEEAYQCHFSNSLDVMPWLKNPETRPDSKYLASAPVSFPLIGLLQLAAFEAVARLLGLSPAGMRSMLAGATGHSQGIVTAVVIAASTDWISFQTLAVDAIGLLLSIGCRSQSAIAAPPARHALITDAAAHSEGVPSHMLSVRRLPLHTVQKLVQEVNTYLPLSAAIEIALHNERTNFVLAGPPASLHGFNVRLREIKAVSGQPESRTPFDKRRPTVLNRFLPISAPFHSSHLAGAVDLVLRDVGAQNGLRIRGSELHMPVYATTADGVDLRKCGHEDIIPRIIRMIIEEPLHWAAATKLPGATHILDFGPGRHGVGAGGLAHAIKVGSGVRVMSVLAIDSTPSFGGLGELLARVCTSTLDLTRASVQGSNMVEWEERVDDHHVGVVYGTNWSRDNGPRLVQIMRGSSPCLPELIVSTRMSRLLGLPPIMVAGMTPTTCSPDFVTAIINAGYHVEFATGGYQSATLLEAALRRVAENIPAGRGITCNLIYANPIALQWQIALLQRLSGEGHGAPTVPIEGLTFGAGVPSKEVAKSYIATFPALKHMSFKPGSKDAIRQVIDIAKAHPKFPIILQWTGGRAGGHHSFEDFHSPILHAYAEIRRHQNIILVAGSGFGDVDGSYPYLTGGWTAQFGQDLPAMPFDGILLGSRVMATKEAKTSRGAKEAIVQAPGVQDAAWTGTYKQPTGGVLTIISEMGEPIHVLATRGMQFWAEMDAMIFSVTDKQERLKRLRAKKTYIIDKLNADYQKVWFGRSGDAAVDLEDMTYAEVIQRLIQLLFLQPSQCWIHDSLEVLVLDFARHAESRFVSQDSLSASVLQSPADLDLHKTPNHFAEQLLARYPQMNEDLIGYQDIQHFLSLCRRKGQKPVPFVPSLDEHFETWFKKDSLWQSEHLEAVPEQDVGRICILQGPVAVKYVKTIDEPVKDLLDGLHNGFIDLLVQEHYDGTASDAPIAQCFGLDIENISSGINLSASDVESRLRILAGTEDDWRQAFFTCKTIVQAGKVVENPIRRLFQQETLNLVQINNAASPGQIEICLRDVNPSGGLSKVVQVRSSEINIIELCFYEHRTASKRPAKLLLKYKYCPQFSFAPIHELMQDREDRIRSFYQQIWFGDIDDPAKNFSIHDEFHSDKVHVTAHDIKQLAATLGNLDSVFAPDPIGKGLNAPMDFAIVAAWKPLMQPLFAPEIQGDLLRLVHLSNSYRIIPGEAPIAEGDILETTARVTAVLNQVSGKMIEVRGRIFRGGSAVMEIESRFLFRGTYKDHENTFQITKEEPMIVRLESPGDVAILKAKPWFHPGASELELLRPQATLVFHLETKVKSSTQDESLLNNVETTGWVEAMIESKLVKYLGCIEHIATASRINPVLSYLQRKGKAERARVMFETPRPLFEDSEEDMIIELPYSNEPYAAVSGDYNPIHTSRHIANYASLPGTITHGMFASGRVRGIIEQQLQSSSAANFFQSFHCSFTGMMLPGDKLQLSVHHIGMVAGTRIIKFEVTKLESGETVLFGEAEVDPPKTAYLFTGQGSQKVGMGMELYAVSEVARDVWDRADEHFLKTYGLRITNIVKNNPKQLVIHFGGRRGRKIRQNYMNLVFTSISIDGTVLRQRCFPDVNEESASYTFSSPTGLLFATQFTQPALTLMEIAAYKDLACRGLVSGSSSYAGHSLGEYSALCAVAELLPVEALMSIVFYRGLTMQFAVERDDYGRSDFGMCAVNPARLSKPIDGSCLQVLARAIASTTATLLEVVNFNIAGQQYVCAGHLRALKCLGDVLDHAHKLRISLVDMATQHDSSKTLEESPLQALILTINHRAPASQEMKIVGLERGVATIPLVGIDVPFHSSYLAAGVSSFRQHLYEKIPQNALDLDRLIGKYVPNLTATPFEVSHAYFEIVFQLTGSNIIHDAMLRWEEFESWSPGQLKPMVLAGYVC